MSNNIIELTEANLSEYLEKNGILLLDFWNARCAPCRAFSQVLDEIAPDYPDVIFAKINTDAEPNLTNEFAVRSVPHIIILRDKVLLYSDSGVLSATVLRQMLDDAKKLDIQKIRENAGNAQ